MSYQRKASIEMEGGLFAPTAHATFRQNVREMLADMAEQGEQSARGIVAPHRVSGALEDSIHGRTSSLSGKRWALTAVVSSNLAEVIAKSRGQKSGHWRGSYAGFIETGFRTFELKMGTDTKGRERKRRVGVGRGSFKGIHMFRDTASRMRTSARDLTKGLT